jgi:beta-galactosidase beta subunit
MPPPLADSMEYVADQAATQPYQHDNQDDNGGRARLDGESVFVVIMVVIGRRNHRDRAEHDRQKHRCR